MLKIWFDWTSVDTKFYLKNCSVWQVRIEIKNQRIHKIKFSYKATRGYHLADQELNGGRDQSKDV